jgi:hypothetical protein
VTEQRDWPPERSAKGSLRPWHATAAGYLAVLKDMVVDHRAEKCWLAALVARQDAEVR